MKPASDPAAHYQAFPARENILAALTRRGVDTSHLTPDQLAPFDQLHTGGADATRALIARLGAKPTDHVLDLGSGLGGPARQLAATGCRVTGIDITPRFVGDAAFLTGCTGQTDRVAFREASVTALPFPDNSFDAAWHIHVAMNVRDKAAMYAECFRVLKPGARIAVDDPVSGQGEVVFPLPWAASAASSYLVGEQELTALMRAAGFRNMSVEDVTDQGIAWFAGIARARPTRTETLRAATPRDVMAANHRANLESGAVRIVSIVAGRP